MILTDYEFQKTMKSIQHSPEQFRQERAALEARGYSPEQIQRATDPSYSFYLGIREEAESYERLRNGNLEELDRFRSIGVRLIALRIFRGLSQAELAAKLGVTEAQVVRDEQNGYSNVTVEKASRILEALGAELQTTFVAAPRSATASEGLLVGN